MSRAFDKAVELAQQRIKEYEAEPREGLEATLHLTTTLPEYARIRNSLTIAHLDLQGVAKLIAQSGHVEQAVEVLIAAAYVRALHTKLADLSVEQEGEE